MKGMVHLYDADGAFVSWGEGRFEFAPDGALTNADPIDLRPAAMPTRIMGVMVVVMRHDAVFVPMAVRAVVKGEPLGFQRGALRVHPVMRWWEPEP